MMLMKVDKRELKGLKLDSWDRKNIAAAIELYEKDNPRGKVQYQDITDETGKTIRWVDYCNIHDYMQDRRKDIINKRKLQASTDHVVRDRPAIVRASMPPGLAGFLQLAYPKLLTDEAQLNQFLKWFPGFDCLKW